MNARILRGLFMEHATRTWPFLSSGLVLGVLLISLADFANQNGFSQHEIEPQAQTIALFVAALGVLYSAADGERLTCELTERTLLLPVSTLVLVAAKFVFNTACIVLLSLLVHVTLRLTVGGSHEEWWYYPTLSMTMFVILQTLALATGCLGDWSLGILFGTYVSMTAFSTGYMDDIALETSTTIAPVLFGFNLLASSAVVHLRRTGRWDPQSLSPRFLATRIQSDSVSLAPFKSAIDAQRWFEAHRIRFFLLTMFIGSAVAVGLFGVVGRLFTERFMQDYSTNERILWAVGQFGMTFPFIFMWSALVAGGVMAFQNYRTQIGPLRAFLYIRPMSSSDLARARIGGALRAAAIPFLITIVLTLGLCSFWLLIEKENPSTLLTDRWSVSQLTAILSVIFLGVAAAAWLAYWTGNIIGGAIVVLISGTLELLLHLTGWVNINSELIQTAVLILIALPICAVLTLAVRAGHLSAARLTLSLFAAAVFALALWFAGYWDNIWSNRDIPWNYRELRDVSVIALFMTLPTASVPLTLHWARHR